MTERIFWGSLKIRKELKNIKKLMRKIKLIQSNNVNRPFRNGKASLVSSLSEIYNSGKQSGVIQADHNLCFVYSPHLII